MTARGRPVASYTANICHHDICLKHIYLLIQDLPGTLGIVHKLSDTLEAQIMRQHQGSQSGHAGASPYNPHPSSGYTATAADIAGRAHAHVPQPSNSYTADVGHAQPTLAPQPSIPAGYIAQRRDLDAQQSPNSYKSSTPGHARPMSVPRLSLPGGNVAQTREMPLVMPSNSHAPHPVNAAGHAQPTVVPRLALHSGNVAQSSPAQAEMSSQDGSAGDALVSDRAGDNQDYQYTQHRHSPLPEGAFLGPQTRFVRPQREPQSPHLSTKAGYEDGVGAQSTDTDPKETLKNEADTIESPQGMQGHEQTNGWKEEQQRWLGVPTGLGGTAGPRIRSDRPTHTRPASREASEDSPEEDPQSRSGISDDISRASRRESVSGSGERMQMTADQHSNTAPSSRAQSELDLGGRLPSLGSTQDYPHEFA